jgi:Domain of unknown function (DUF4412)
MRRLVPALAASLLTLPALTFIAVPAFMFIAVPAWADQMPNVIPTHDVTGTYLFTGQNGPQTVTVEYSKSANTLRLNPPQGGGYVLYDFGTKDAKMVMPQMQRYMDAPNMSKRAQAWQGGANGDDVTITTGGTETIAGHECTDYTATDHTKGKSSTLCVTDDGVILKLASEKDTAVAQSISYDTVPDADVQVPPGYTQFVMPQLPPGMGNMGAMAPGAMSGMGNMNGVSVPGSTP